ncbi:hypothetical protein [Kitasatospora camelliae]|uniref:Uncharacterized protein n=1 Tax=Kitasatospora camelliae TaxID=3156397 RepID=A0AAU8K0P2_9ACTN
MNHPTVLPVTGAALASVPRVREAAASASARFGVDLLDDAVAARVVADHERLRDTGGWHDEVGGLLVIGGVVAALVLGGDLGSPVQAKVAAQFGAACLAVPLGVLRLGAGEPVGRSQA